MLFNSFPFLFFFLPAALLGFHLAASVGPRPAKMWLVAASLAFYTYWHPPFALLLLGSIGFNYLAGIAVRREKRALAPAVAANLLALFHYKYAYTVAGFLLNCGLIDANPLDPVLLPLGISFFTFTQIGYLVDCAAGEVEEKSLLDYVLFVTFFPHLIAGPILHHREIMPQFADRRTYRLDPDNLARGAALFAIGLFKKVQLADSVAPYADPGFADPGQLALFGAWGSALCYSLQLYFDFSGYSDMAIGIARMCNIRFPLNFNAPYKAGCIIDFWQRWHMTLTRYLTLLLFNPLELWAARRRAARGKPVTRKAMKRPVVFLQLVALPMTITMGLAGVWHGAGLQFLIFGLLHAVFLSVNHAWRIWRPASLEFLVRRLGGALTYLAVLVGQVFFRAQSVPAALSMLAAMLGLHGVEKGASVPNWLPAKLGAAGVWLADHGVIAVADQFSRGGGWVFQLAAMILLYALVWRAPNSHELAESPVKLDARRGMAAGLIGVVAVLGIGAKSEFLYFQF